MTDFEILAAAINRAWLKRYGGAAVTDADVLAKRVESLGSDRDCWLFNAHANQREYLKLDRVLRRRGWWCLVRRFRPRRGAR